MVEWSHRLEYVKLFFIVRIMTELENQNPHLVFSLLTFVTLLLLTNHSLRLHA